MTINNDKQGINDKLEFFLENKIKIHLTKHNKEFLNGVLVCKKEVGVFILREDFKGEMYIFLNEIFDVEEFKERRKEDVIGSTK